MKAQGPLWRLRVPATSESEEAVSELLGRLFGQSAVTHRNTVSGKVSVSIFLSRKAGFNRTRRRELRSGLQELRELGLDPGQGGIRLSQVASQDWATSWKKHFKPWAAGPSLLVKPSWSRIKPLKGQAVMVLDPGLSFGTGQHPTTRFCLKQLARLRLNVGKASLLDMGCGSGILAIGAALLGYARVEAFDFDPDCVRIARANARNNGVDARIRISRRDLTLMPPEAERRFTVVCANLIHDLLISERRRILSRVQPGGWLVLAGILKEQFPAVEAAYRREGWVLKRGRTEGEWRSGLFVEK
ncbi:MAG: 50S ribosomal protein L11 methyltransferase [Verrucomicrobia bacterium]|nr:50S ribosomal protein L11 methyltransferase [Verrucomicrobiota bacterium]